MTTERPNNESKRKVTNLEHYMLKLAGSENYTFEQLATIHSKFDYDHVVTAEYLAKIMRLDTMQLYATDPVIAPFFKQHKLPAKSMGTCAVCQKAG